MPFVWRAMEWARPDGQIAFALHARLLFQQGDGMPTARQALFEALDVTSIINGAELRQTKVWPHVSAPFCILFATNRKSGAGAGFRFISPRIEESLNRAGTMRIDALNADIVPTRQSQGDANHGKESRKFNWGCTICRYCRWFAWIFHRPGTAGKPSTLAGTSNLPGPGGEAHCGSRHRGRFVCRDHPCPPCRAG